jgi:RAB protein geranylgeranyltransferase component A
MDSYGGTDATFTLDAFAEWLAALQPLTPDATHVPQSCCRQLAEGQPAVPVGSARTAPFFASRSSPPAPPPESLLQQRRRFAIDVHPRYVLARGALIDLLVRSEVSNYLEFKTMEAQFVFVGDESGGHIERVPTSRNDLFGSKSLGLLDKRRLMKFMQVALCTRVRRQRDAHSRAPERPLTVATVGGRCCCRCVQACTDHLTETQGVAVQMRNEVGLGQARSLTRYGATARRPQRNSHGV